MSGRTNALAADDPGGLFGRRGVDIDAEHARTFARECHRGCLAVTPAGTDRARADHNRYFVFQAISHLMNRSGRAPCSTSPRWGEVGREAAG